ncbi:MAG: hypothetical protein IPL26_16100 [Leptospiraceae bacterium]|nr:hypothetical protein [Leptospiraceae bacterium]
METITLKVSNPADKEVILLLAQRLKMKVITETSNIQKVKRVAKNSNEALTHLENIAKLGTLKKKIPDPVKWQKSLREDRKLPGR